MNVYTDNIDTFFTDIFKQLLLSHLLTNSSVIILADTGTPTFYNIRFLVMNQ